MLMIRLLSFLVVVQDMSTSYSRARRISIDICSDTLFLDLLMEATSVLEA